jgi:HEAT repeat protein
MQGDFKGFLILAVGLSVGLAHAESGGLSDQLLSSDPATQTAALQSFAKLDIRQKRELLPSLRSALKTNATMAERSARALSQMGGYSEPAIPELIQALAYDEESVFAPVRDALVNAGAASVPSLEKALTDSNFFVRRRAAQTLGKLQGKAAHAAPMLVKLLEDPQYDVHAAAEAALLSIGESAIGPVASGLRTDDENARRTALTMLSKLGPLSAPYLIDALKHDPSGYVRVTAAESLGDVKGAPLVVPALIESLNDLEDGIRAASADSLGALGDAAKPAVGMLIVASLQDKEPLVKSKAGQALTKIGPWTAASVPGLARGMRQQDPQIRIAIIKALGDGTLSLKEAAPVLISALRDSDPAVRMQAIESVTKLGKGSAEVVPLLRASLSDGQVEIRRTAAAQLGHCQNAPAEAAAALAEGLRDSDPTVRRAVIEALTMLGPAGVPGLLQAERDDNAVLVDEAVKNLTALGQDALPALEKIAQGPDAVLQKKAADAIQRIQSQGSSRPHKKSHAR